MQATYFIMIAAICTLFTLIALVAYTVRKISPRSFRLTVALARMFSFNVEIEAHAQDPQQVLRVLRGRDRDNQPPSLP